MNFSEEIFSIPATTLDLFRSMLQTRRDKIKDYKLVITGGIGAGKSTACQLIKELFEMHGIPINTIREYINYDPNGQQVLADFISGKISNFMFQNYILDTYKLQCAENRRNGITIIERPPEDSIACFANITYSNTNELVFEQLEKLWSKVKNIVDVNDLPSYNDFDETQTVGLVSRDLFKTINDIISIIDSDLAEGVSKRIVVLVVKDVKQTKNRIAKRGRECESSYSDEYLNTINNFYVNVVKFNGIGTPIDLELFEELLKF